MINGEVKPDDSTQDASNPASETQASYFRLSPMQQGMLYHALDRPGAGIDIEQMVVTLEEPLDAYALREAWERVTDRHGALRTAFRWTDTAPVQYVVPSVPLPWTQIDLSGPT